MGGAEVFSNYVEVAKGGEKGLGWVAEDKFCGESADGDVAAADSVKKGGVGGAAEGAGNICGESSVFKVRDRGCSGIDGES